MTLPLDTAPGPSPDAESRRNAGISRELLAKARRELDAGDLLQASNKAWGAAAFALKAVAEKRRWFNEADWKLRRIASIVSDELNDQQIIRSYDSTRLAHFNFYQHEYDHREVEQAIEAAAYVVAQLEPTLSPDYEPPYINAATTAKIRSLEQPTSSFDQARLANGRPPMEQRPPVTPTPPETAADNGAAPE